MVRDSNLDDDPLRMLKGIRVAMRLGFEIEPRTLAAIRKRAPKLAAVAAERVSDELLAIFSQPLLGRAVALLSATGLDAVLFGRRMEGPVVASSFAQVGASGYDEAVIAFALIFRDPRNPPRPFAERWRWSRALRADVETVIKYAARLIAGSDIATTLYYAGAAAAPRLVWFLRAGNQLELAALVEDVLRDRGQTIFGVQALLDGDEVAEIARIPAGPQVGRLKRLMIEGQLKGQLRTRQEAEEFVRRSVKALPPLGV
jgi:tRNA nucleotidyltransferase/poly(A) polymerase